MICSNIEREGSDVIEKTVGREGMRSISRGGQREMNENK